MARDRSIKLIIQAQVDGAKRALRETADAAKQVGAEADKSSKQATTASERMVRSARDNSQAWNTAGTTLTAFGAASALALGGSAKAAIDWESAWAGVTKTVEGSSSQMAELQEGLRGMARELPASHSEIAAVAEAAGQLGIQTPNILDFTRTMIDLGESTNLSAEQAATSLARFANIMGTSQSEFSNIGSAVVELGNNFATTEAEIVEMGLRLAGAGRQAGLTEAEVLGLAASLSSVGIEAEAGGTAFSRVLIEMGTAVDTQNEKLDTFAKTAGMSSEEFRAAWSSDPGSAVGAFIEGMGAIDASGQSIQPILEELGMTDIRIGDALRRSAAAADLFSGAMDTSTSAFDANTALAAEAQQRYETVASRLDMAKNSAIDAGISLGEVFLPAIGAAADGVADFAGFLADLPPGIQGIAAGLSGTTAAVGLLGGAFFLMAPRIIESYDAMQDILGISPRVSSSLGSIGRTVAKGGVLVGGLVALGGALQMVDQATWAAAPGIEETRGALLSLQETADATRLDELVANMDIDANGLLGGQINTIGDAFDRLANPTMQQKLENLDSAFGWRTSADQAREALQPLDTLLAEMATTSEGAAQASDLLNAVLQGSSTSTQQAMEHMPGFRDALAGVANEAAAADPSLEGLTAEMEESAIAAEEAAAATQELRDSYNEWLTEMGSASASFATIEGALAAHQAATQEWAQGQADATESADDSWEDFYDGHTVNLEKYLGELESMVEAQENWQGNMESLVGRVSDATIDHLARLGPEGAPLVAALVDGSAEELARFDELFAESGEGAGLAWAEGLRGQRALYNAAATELGEGAAAEILAAVQAGEMTVAEAVLEYDLRAEMEVAAETDLAAADVLTFIADTEAMTAIAKVDADTGLALGQAEAWYFDTNSMRPVPLVDANADLAFGESNSWANWTRSLNPSANVGARTGDAWSSVRGLLNSINSSWATVNVQARLRTSVIGLGAAVVAAAGNYTGGMVTNRAAGGVVSGYAPHVAGPATGITDLYRMGLDGALTHYAESGKGLSKEWYLSDHPSYRRQNIGYAVDALKHLGGSDLIKGYATGGMNQRYGAMAPVVSYATPAASSGPVTAYLAAEHVALLERALDRPARAYIGAPELNHGIARYNQQSARGEIR